MTMKGIEILLKNIDEYTVEKERGVEKALWNVAGRILYEAKKNCVERFTGTPSWNPEPGTPTGRLGSSLTMASSWGKRTRVTGKAKQNDAVRPPTGEGKSVVVGTNISYSLFPELGTRKMYPRPYLFPAYFAHVWDIITELKKVFKHVKGDGQPNDTEK